MVKLLYIILLSFFLQAVYGQADKGFIYSIDKNLYYHQGDTLAFNEMEHVFLHSMEYSKRYMRTKRALGTGKFFGWMSVSAIGGGFALLLIDQGTNQNCEWICLTTGQIIGIFSIISLAPLSGTIGLIAHFGGKSNKQSLINDYNIMIEESGKVKQIPSLNLGASSGFGLTLKF